jgi:pyruvyltransferase
MELLSYKWNGMNEIKSVSYHVNKDITFEDRLGILITERIVGHKVLLKEHSNTAQCFCAGSVLHLARPIDIVWGCGVLNYEKINHGIDIRTIRGPLTAKVMIDSGYDIKSITNVYGDACLLLSTLYTELNGIQKKRVKITIGSKGEVTTQNDILEILEAVSTSRLVTTDSLYVLIVCDSFGVNCIYEGEVSIPVQDYLLSTGRGFDKISSTKILNQPVLPNINELLGSFPSDLNWGHSLTVYDNRFSLC